MISRSRNLLVLALTLCGAAGLAQSSPTLFTVGDHGVSAEEFDYIYRKTNADSADYSQASVEEYLDLYKRFKLKVAKARALQLDTVQALRQELNGYRRQLTDSYVADQEITEPLARELFERRNADVDILHIAVKLPAAGQDTSAAFAKIRDARRRVAAGEDWAAVARGLSEDPSVAQNGGSVGFVTAPLPAGLYALENAIYETAIGEVSDIVRSEQFYHIIRPTSRRAARGEIEAAHIFIRKDTEAGGDPAAAKTRIDSIYAALERGEEFDELAADLSEDTRSAPRGGYIGFFGINRYDRTFEDAAFGIAENGEYSAPVETNVGWHILKRVSRRPQGEWPQVKQELYARVKRMPRYEEGEAAMVRRMQSKYGFRQNQPAVDALLRNPGDSLFLPEWSLPTAGDVQLFNFGAERRATTQDFKNYLSEQSARRLQLRGVAPDQAFEQLYEEFVADQTVAYTEERLNVDNPAFYNLMREYEEGILLFEATKENVWDKASQDTVGLEAFYRANAARYQWDERVVVDYYTMPSSQRTALEASLLKFARKHSPEEVLAKFNADTTVVTHVERTVERGREPQLDAMTWKRGLEVPALVDDARKTVRVGLVQKVLPKGAKKLNEARGYVIADYQDELERRWVSELEREFPIVVNGEVLESIIK